MNFHYEKDVIVEKVTGPPYLIEKEETVHEAKIGLPATILLVAIILTFVPPFIWGILILVTLFYKRRNEGVWLTNKRLVHFVKIPFTNQYRIKSVPINQIRKIRNAPLSITPFADMFDRMLGVGDLQVFVKDSSFAEVQMHAIKKPKLLMKKVKDIIGDKIEE